VQARRGHRRRPCDADGHLQAPQAGSGPPRSPSFARCFRRPARYAGTRHRASSSPCHGAVSDREFRQQERARPTRPQREVRGVVEGRTARRIPGRDHLLLGAARSSSTADGGGAGTCRRRDRLQLSAALEGAGQTARSRLLQPAAPGRAALDQPVLPQHARRTFQRRPCAARSQSRLRPPGLRSFARTGLPTDVPPGAAQHARLPTVLPLRAWRLESAHRRPSPSAGLRHARCSCRCLDLPNGRRVRPVHGLRARLARLQGTTQGG